MSCVWAFIFSLNHRSENALLLLPFISHKRRRRPIYGAPIFWARRGRYGGRGRGDLTCFGMSVGKSTGFDMLSIILQVATFIFFYIWHKKIFEKGIFLSCNSLAGDILPKPIPSSSLLSFFLPSSTYEMCCLLFSSSSPPLFLFLLFPPTEVKATFGTKKEPKEKKKNRTFASSFHSPEKVAKSGRGFCMYIKEMLLCTKARVVGGRILL